MAENWWFSNSSTMTTFTSWHSAFYCKQELPSLSFMKNGYGLTDPCFISQWFVIHYWTQLLSRACCPRLDQRPPWAGCLYHFWALPYWDIPGSSCAHPTHSLESATWPRSSGSWWRMVLETSTWVLEVLIASRMCLLLGTFSSQSEEIYARTVYMPKTNTCKHILTHMPNAHANMHVYTHSPFSLPALVTFYKAATNTELANTGALLKEAQTGLGSCKPLITAFSLTDRYITLFYMCSFRDILFTIFCWFINIEFTANSTIFHALTKFI